MSETSPLITFIGAGNMGSALMAGLIAQGHPPEKLWACDPSAEKLAVLEKELGLCTSSTPEAAVKKAQVVVLAVKPQQLPELAVQLAPLLSAQRPLILSIAAGIKIARLETWLGAELAIIRSMPNLAAQVGESASGLYSNAHSSSAQKKQAEGILNSVGLSVWVTAESQLDMVTALSGSGPAYFFLVMEALQQTAEEAGLTKEVAQLLTLQTAKGAACLAQAAQQDLATLRDRVTSPGGTTAAALAVLEKGKLRELFKAALLAAEKRAQELSQLEEKH